MVVHRICSGLFEKMSVYDDSRTGGSIKSGSLLETQREQGGDSFTSEQTEYISERRGKKEDSPLNQSLSKIFTIPVILLSRKGHHLLILTGEFSLFCHSFPLKGHISHYSNSKISVTPMSLVWL